MWSVSYVQGLEVVDVHMWLGSAIFTLPFPVSGAGWSCWGGMRASRMPCLEKKRLGHSVLSKVVMPYLKYQLQESPLFPAWLAVLTNIFWPFFRTSDSVLSHTPFFSLWYFSLGWTRAFSAIGLRAISVFLSSPPISRQGKEVVLGRKMVSE